MIISYPVHLLTEYEEENEIRMREDTSEKKKIDGPK